METEVGAVAGAVVEGGWGKRGDGNVWVKVRVGVVA